VSAYSVNNIIPVSTTISSAGLGYANFASAFLFAPNDELPVGFTVDTIRVYSTLAEVGNDFPSTSETYLAAQRWLGGIPATNSLTVYGKASDDATITDTLNKARNSYWWYWTFMTADIYASVANATLVADWCESNESFFMNCQTGTNVDEIRDPSDDTDIASAFTTAGYRHSATFAHATDPYAGIAVCKWLAGVNYSGVNTTLTGEFKKLSGVDAESLPTTEYNAMKQDTKKCMFYSVVDLQGATDGGRVINSWTHSAFGEYFDDVVNLDAFVNALKTDVFNAVAGQPTKLSQTSRGQAVINGAARSTCQRYISNGFLGERNYIDPDTGEENKYTPGYEILTDPEDILDISDADRAARKSAVLRIRIFRAGAIHTAPIDLTVY